MYHLNKSQAFYSNLMERKVQLDINLNNKSFV